MKGKLDFIPNKLNKYSIRRFSVGTASILVGATLLFGAAHEAKAEETTKTSELSSGEATTPEDPSTNTQSPQNETIDAPAEAQAVNTNQTEESTDNVQPQPEGTVDQEKDVSNEKQETLTPETASETSSQDVEMKQEDPSSAETQPASTPQKDEQSSGQEIPEASSPQENSEETTILEDPNQPKTDEILKQNTENDGTTQKETQTATTQPQTDKNGSAEATNDVKPQNNETTLQQKTETDGTEETKASMPAPLEMNTDDANAPTGEKDTTATDANATTDEADTTDVNSQNNTSLFAAAPQDATAADDTSAPDSQVRDANEPTGALVNDKVEFKNFALNNDGFNPNNSGNTRLSSEFQVQGTVREGDYFTFMLPENLTGDGDVDYSNVNNTMVLPDLLNGSGQVVATGDYNTENKTGTYVFTDYVNDKDNVSGRFDLSLFTDRKNTPNSGTYPVEFDLAGEKFNADLNIDYGNPAQGDDGFDGANVTSFITDIDLDSGKNEYKQTIYVNPKGNELYDSTVTLLGHHGDPTTSSTLVDSDNTNLRIYEVQDNSKLTDSYYVDPNDSNYVDVTNDFTNWINDNGNNSMTIDFGNINKSYVVLVDGHYDNSGKNVQTRVFEENYRENGDYTSYYWDNENFLEQGSGSADGDNRPKYKLGDYVWEDVDQDGIQGSDEREQPLSGVNVTLKNANGEFISSTQTDEEGRYVFEDLDNGDYIVEFETPEGYEETPVGRGTDGSVDSNAKQVTVSIQDADDMTIDKGFYKPTPEAAPTYKLGDYVWEDVDQDGIQGTDEKEQPLSGVTVTLKNNNGEVIGTTTTNEEGHYEFTGLANGDYTVEFETPEGYEETPTGQGTDEGKDSNEKVVNVTIQDADNMTIDKGFHKPTYKLGDYVWEDVDQDGIQGTDDNEKPIPGVTVTLKDANGVPVNKTTTDDKGYYEFTGLTNGDYTVEFETPEGYEETPTGQGTDKGKDSNEKVVNVTINGKDDVTIDKGFYKPTYKLGDYVWEDVDQDGIQGTDDNEKPMSGVTVTLKNNNGEVIGTTTTDDKGYYEFTGLENGDYTVEFDTPEGYQETPTGQGTDEGKDSNEKVVNVTIQDADNMTIDKGFFKEEPTTPEEPGTPDEPNTPPTTPEEPGTPDEPNTPPTTPEEPGTPDEPNTPPTTPEEPGTPDDPNTPPTTPEEPGTPDEPNTPPTTPEEPGTPDEPNTPPTTPEEPGTPDEPNTPPTTPEEPGTPDEPNTPSTTPEEPGTPGDPNTPVTTSGEPNQPGVEGQTPSTDESGDKEDALPETGSDSTSKNTTLFGALFAGLGSLLLFGRRKRRKE
ncbi:SdrD B-like domain-containing protein [Staphylococcus sp. 11262D007BW]